MKITPVIMTDFSVRAIHARTKTQTRRLPSDRWNRLEAGDRLYVKEGGYVLECADTSPARTMNYRACGWEFADGFTIDAPRDEASDYDRKRKQSPIHMPRWASRLTLEVTEVRHQRLQDISEEDAIAEGCARHPMINSSKREFRSLWDKLHGKGAWEQNPDVVAVTFFAHTFNVDKLP